MNNQLMLWPGPRRVRMLSYSSARPTRRVVGHRALSVMQQLAHQLYTLGTPPHPLGDYGDILVHGMTEDAPDGSTLLMRTGPFVPPISKPAFTLIVTNAVRAAMEPQKFTGFEFARVEKHRIVRVDWRGWDPTTEEPAEFPESGEPEDYETISKLIIRP